jgi:outer membrane protein assembly factor BamB
MAQVASLPESLADWPTFRANNIGTVTTSATLTEQGQLRWQYTASPAITPTAPTAAGGLVFYAGSDGIVRALDAATGKLRWKAYAGGAIRFPPTIWKGRALVGSGDGWVYALEARTGRLLWRFRTAPMERRIPVYDHLLSTWPAASGVLVADGVAYAAAGIVNYDGTYIYALDAVTGQMKWQNNSSGHLDATALSGVSVQGHMILHDGKIWLAGGNVVSPALYDINDGKCLNRPGLVHRVVNNNVPAAEGPRGWELYLVGDRVMVSGKPFYAHPKYPVYDSSVFNKTLVASTADRDLIWVNNAQLICFNRIQEKRNERLLAAWGKPNVPGLQPQWERTAPDSRAVALCPKAVVMANRTDIIALSLQDGSVLWTQPLPAPPVPWGLAVDRDGRVIVSLETGHVLCFGHGPMVAGE